MPRQIVILETIICAFENEAEPSCFIVGGTDQSGQEWRPTTPIPTEGLALVAWRPLSDAEREQCAKLRRGSRLLEQWVLASTMTACDPESLPLPDPLSAAR